MEVVLLQDYFLKSLIVHSQFKEDFGMNDTIQGGKSMPYIKVTTNTYWNKNEI